MSTQPNPPSYLLPQTPPFLMPLGSRSVIYFLLLPFSWHSHFLVSFLLLLFSLLSSHDVALMCLKQTTPITCLTSAFKERLPLSLNRVSLSCFTWLLENSRSSYQRPQCSIPELWGQCSWLCILHLFCPPFWAELCLCLDTCSTGTCRHYDKLASVSVNALPSRGRGDRGTWNLSY